MSDYSVAEQYVLPSGGKIYDTPFDPHVRLRSMTVLEEMKRQSGGDSMNAVLCEIIDSCLITKLPVSCYDLAVPDYEYLLHKLRVVTYGPEYNMVVGCPHCKAKGLPNIQKYSADLDKLEVKTLGDEESLAEFQKCREFTLPKCGKKIKLRISTARLQDEIQNLTKEYNEKHPEYNGDMSPLFTLQTMIESVDGAKLGYIELQELIKHMSAADYNVIIQKLDRLNTSFGINKLISIKCPRCKGDITTFFRWTQEFFRPQID